MSFRVCFKETGQNEIMKDDDMAGRQAKMEEDKALFGKKYVLFPNPTNGHWLAGIFGQSEPDNRKLLKKVAAGKL